MSGHYSRAVGELSHIPSVFREQEFIFQQTDSKGVSRILLHNGKCFRIRLHCIIEVVIHMGDITGHYKIVRILSKREC